MSEPFNNLIPAQALTRGPLANMPDGTLVLSAEGPGFGLRVQSAAEDFPDRVLVLQDWPAAGWRSGDRVNPGVREGFGAPKAKLSALLPVIGGSFTRQPAAKEFGGAGLIVMDDVFVLGVEDRDNAFEREKYACTLAGVRAPLPHSAPHTENWVLRVEIDGAVLELPVNQPVTAASQAPAARGTIAISD